LAALGRRVSSNAGSHALCGNLEPLRGVPSPRSRAGAMGLLAVADSVRSDVSTAEREAYGEDTRLLTSLISPIGAGNSAAISKILLTEFGTLPNIFAAAEDNAISEKYVLISRHLKTIKRSLSRILRREVTLAAVIPSTEALIRYLHYEMAHLARETVRVLFLDSGNYIIHEQTMWEGTVNEVQIHPREIIGIALRKNATSLILVHNHPSGNALASSADIAATNALSSAAASLGLVLHDHLILARSGYTSFREGGFMDSTDRPTEVPTSIGDRGKALWLYLKDRMRNAK
jgi:DNA repair protein RadC